MDTPHRTRHRRLPRASVGPWPPPSPPAAGGWSSTAATAPGSPPPSPPSRTPSWSPPSPATSPTRAPRRARRRRRPAARPAGQQRLRPRPDPAARRWPSSTRRGCSGCWRSTRSRRWRWSSSLLPALRTGRAAPCWTSAPTPPSRPTGLGRLRREQGRPGPAGRRARRRGPGLRVHAVDPGDMAHRHAPRRGPGRGHGAAVPGGGRARPAAPGRRAAAQRPVPRRGAARRVAPERGDADVHAPAGRRGHRAARVARAGPRRGPADGRPARRRRAPPVPRPAGLLAPGDLVVVNTSATLPPASRRGGPTAPSSRCTCRPARRRRLGGRAPPAGQRRPRPRRRARLRVGAARRRARSRCSPVIPTRARPSRLWRARPEPTATARAYLPRHGRPIGYGYLRGDFPLAD